MLNTEVLWNKALTDNSVRVITRWLRSLTAEGQRDVDKNLARFNYWLQCSMELTKKELITFCVGQCHGLWMFLDQTSYTKLRLLIQKLQNLLLLAHLVSGHACVMCQINMKAMTRCGCWNLDLHALRQHILLGRLVQWWSFSGLLPQYPDANKLKHISQMWREMSQHHKATSLELRCNTVDKSRWSSIIQGMVAHMQKQHGPLWVSEDWPFQTYPPPSLYSLLKIVLVPNTDTTSALAINSLEKLLSQEPGSSWLSWHSYAVLRTLLRQDQRQAALKYLYYSMPAIEHTQDARLYMDVLLQNNHVAEALILLKQCHPGNDYLLAHFLCSCQNLGEDVLASIRKDILSLKLLEGQNSCNPEEINQKKSLSDKVEGNKFVVKGRAPTPLSALLYQCLFSGSLTSADLLRLFKEAVTELNSSNKRTRVMVVWPTYLEKTNENKSSSQSRETFCQLSVSLSPVELQKEEPDFELLQNDRMVHVSPACASSGFTSAHNMESACSFLSSPSVSPAEWRQEETMEEERSSLSDNLRPFKAVTQCCSYITLPVGDAPEAMLIKSLSRENIDERVVSDNTGTIPGNGLDSACMVDVTQTEESNKDKQTMPIDAARITVEGDIFFMPDFEKIIDDAREPHESNKAEDESEQFSVLSSERVYCQDSICNKASGSSSFLDLKPLRRALPCSPVERNFRSFRYDSYEAIDQPEILTSCAVTETMQDLLEQNLTLKDEEPIQPSSLVSVRSSILVMDFNPVRRDSHPHQLQSSFGVPLLPSSPAETTKDKAASERRSTGIKEVVCFRTTSDRVGDCKLGSWWKQAVETRRASAGLLPAIEQIPAVTKEKRHSLVIGWPHSYGLIRGLKKEDKQATKEELSSRKVKGKMDKQYKKS